MNAKAQSALFRGPSLSFSDAIDDFLGFVAIEKGLSDDYQLSNRRSLQELPRWCQERGFQDPRTVQTDDLTAYLSYLKTRPRRAPVEIRKSFVYQIPPCDSRLSLYDCSTAFSRSRHGLKRDPAGVPLPIQLVLFMA